MRRKSCLLSAILILIMGGFVFSQAKIATGPYKLLKTIAIGGESGWDYLATDAQTLQTASGSRTMTLDPTTHKIYLSSVDYTKAPETPPAGRPSGKFARPQPVPNSFKVLVYGLNQK